MQTPTSSRASSPVGARLGSLLLHPAGAVLALTVWLLLSIAWRPLLLPDEGRYALVALEMARGDAWLPTLHGLPYFHKPPMLYWLDLMALRAFGIHEWATRLGPALGAWLMAVAVYLDQRRRTDPMTASVTLGVLGSTVLFFVSGQYINHDMLVAGWITLTLLCARRAVEPGASHALGWLVAAWASAAAGVLSKGLIGVVLPMLVLGPWLLAQGRWRDVLRLLNPVGLIVFAALSVPWFLAMQARYAGFLDYFFLEQHVRRFAQSGFNNVQPFWFYLVVLPVLTLPWSLWLLPAIRAARQTSWRSLIGSDTGFFVWWLVVVVGFFSLPSSKLVGYVLPAVAPWCILLARAVAQGRQWRWLVPLSGALCLGVVAFVARQAPQSNQDVGMALRAHLSPGAQVVFVDAPFFDVPFYAQLPQAPMILADWNDPNIPKRDSWRKELWDAGRLDPEAGHQHLVSGREVATWRCRTGEYWFVADKGWQAPAELGPLERVFSGKRADLYRGGPRPASCP